MKVEYHVEGHSVVEEEPESSLSDSKGAWNYPGFSTASPKSLDTCQSWNIEVAHWSPSSIRSAVHLKFVKWLI